MKTAVLNKKSWHFSVAKRVHSEYQVECCEDLCEYRGKVISAILVLLFIYSLAGFVLYCFMDLAIAIYFWVYPNPPGIVALGLLSAVSLGGAYVGITVWLRNLKENRQEAPEPGFLKLSYMSLREKFCVRVEFK